MEQFFQGRFRCYGRVFDFAVSGKVTWGLRSERERDPRLERRVREERTELKKPIKSEKKHWFFDFFSLFVFF